MKRTIVTLLLTLAAFLSLGAREYQVRGPQGGISFKVSLSEGFNPETDHCPMVILMPGIFSSKDYNPMPALAKGLARSGIASMAAGRLAQKGSDVPKCMVLVAPGSPRLTEFRSERSCPIPVRFSRISATRHSGSIGPRFSKSMLVTTWRPVPANIIWIRWPSSLTSAAGASAGH